jgi:hypothetical protein
MSIVSILPKAIDILENQFVYLCQMHIIFYGWGLKYEKRNFRDFPSYNEAFKQSLLHQMQSYFDSDYP